MRPFLAVASLAALLMAGCTSTHGPAAPAEATPAEFQQPVFEGAADHGTPAGSPSAHGSPQRDDGSVETGTTPTQVPGAYAKRTVTISNDFGGAALGTVFVGLSGGSIEVAPGDGPGYTIVATLEAHALTEQDARDALDRLELTHTDQMEADGLHLTTVVKEKPAPQPIPLVQIGDATWTEANVKVTLPAGPAYDLGADASSGDVKVTGLRGPGFNLSASSGDVDVDSVNAGTLSLATSSGDIGLDTVQAERADLEASSGDVTGKAVRFGAVKAETSSGGIELQGTADTLTADASSGSLQLELHGLASGAYHLSASSGDVALKVLSGMGHAYHVRADASSGSVHVALDDADTLSDKDDHAEVETHGFDAAPIQTVVDAETSSGDITIQG